MTVNKNNMLFVLFLYFFLFKSLIEKVIPIFGYADEIIALAAIPLAASNIGRKCGRIWFKRKGYSYYVIIAVISGLAGNLIFHYQPMLEVALPDLFLNLKFWLCIYVGENVLRGFDIHRYAKKVSNHIFFFVWLYVILMLLDNIYPVFSSNIRYGMRSTQLFYDHPTVFAANCVFLMAVLLLIRDDINITKEKRYFILLSLLMCSTLRSKMFGCILAFWLIYYFVFFRRKKFQLRTVFMFIPIAVLLGWEQIEYYFFSTIRLGSARYQLLVKAFEIAKDHFPIGTGFGTFGSHYSAVAYSPLYREYGLSTIQGLMEGNADFVSDSYWPMILGQCGWIGLFATLGAILMLLFRVQRLQTANVSGYAAGLFILAYLMIESTASSAFVHPLSMPLALLLGYIFHSLRKKRPCLKR